MRTPRRGPTVPTLARTSPGQLTRALLLGLALAATSACGGGAAQGTKGGTPGGSSSGSGGSSGSSGSPTSSSGSGPSCAGTSSKAERLPLDIYVMLDRSGSMDESTGDNKGTKWDAVTAALSSFVGQPLEGISVGLQYFALPRKQCSATNACSGDAECSYCGGRCLLGRCVSWGRADSCDAADYAVPEVEIGLIADTASRIRASMSTRGPATDTPTSAALQGAIDHARSWASAHAGHAVVALLATDGEPTECEVNLDEIDKIAAKGLSASPSIRTFVIGVGVSLSNLNGIAKAGGTGAAYLVDTGADVSTQFLRALNEIRGKTVGCSYVIPPPPAGQQLDFARVNVSYRVGGGAAVTFGKVADAAACGASAHAWHYDDAAAPASIVLCPATCTAVEADAAASVEIVLGCQTSGEW